MYDCQWFWSAEETTPNSKHADRECGSGLRCSTKRTGNAYSLCFAQGCSDYTCKISIHGLGLAIGFSWLLTMHYTVACATSDVSIDLSGMLCAESKNYPKCMLSKVLTHVIPILKSSLRLTDQSWTGRRWLYWMHAICQWIEDLKSKYLCTVPVLFV